MSYAHYNATAKQTNNFLQFILKDSIQEIKQYTLNYKISDYQKQITFNCESIIEKTIKKIGEKKTNYYNINSIAHIGNDIKYAISITVFLSNLCTSCLMF